MKRITIVIKEKAISRLAKINDKNSICYYLDDDYIHFVELQNKFEGQMKIRNLAGLFDIVFQEIKYPYLELIAEINKTNESLEWWSGHIASRNTASIPLAREITYLFCANEILEASDENLIFIVKSRALSICLANLVRNRGDKVVFYQRKVNEYLVRIKRFFYHLAQGAYFLFKSAQYCLAAFRFLKPLPPQRSLRKKRIVVRTWVTKGNFSKTGEFKERVFGDLAKWLRSSNYEVWILPMFFDLSMKISKVFSLIKAQKEQFLIPHHYLKPSDYLKFLYQGFRLFRIQFKNLMLEGVDVTPLFNEAIRQILMIPDLCYAMLKRLKDAGYEIDGFYYPFEGNSPEKPFILGCRKYYPNSKIVGFQHAPFYPNQLAFYLHANEIDCHPFPDELVCSGPLYVDLLKHAGLPPKKLTFGPNLRFKSVYIESRAQKFDAASNFRKILLPLTCLYSLAFDLILKTHTALKGNKDYEIYIRNHPLLDKKTIEKFLGKIGMHSYQFADTGIIQDWLPRVQAVISPGCSVVTLEAMAMGTPVIRIIPDNTFSYDPFCSSYYPFEPVSSASQINEQLQSIDGILNKDKDFFVNIGKRVLEDYFAKPTDENKRMFLLS